MKTLASALVLTSVAAMAWGQAPKVEMQPGSSSVVIQNGTVVTQSSGVGSSASVTTGVAPNAQIQGITVINGEVWIDGEKVPPDAKRFTGQASGKTYVIERSGGSVKVHEQ